MLVRVVASPLNTTIQKDQDMSSFGAIREKLFTEWDIYRAYTRTSACVTSAPY